VDVRFVLVERVRRLRFPLSEEERREWRYQGKEWKYEDQASGELALRIQEYLGKGERTAWRDTVQTPLESRIDQVVHGLLTAMVLRKDYERKRIESEQERWRREQERAEIHICSTKMLEFATLSEVSRHQKTPP
jgi:hypothetical protein